MLSLIPLLAVMPPVQAEEVRLLRYPAIHGDTIVFNYAGDLWVAKTDGDNARRLTSHPGLETRPKISPDGTMVAFTGSYDGNPDVYVIPIEGGEPKRLTYEAPNDNVLCWTPDGKIAFATTSGMPYGQQRLMIANPDGGLPARTAIEEVTELSYLDKDTVAYTRTPSYQFNWRRYRGGTQGRISIYKFSTNTYSELPSAREQSYFPMAIGGDIYYTSDKNQGTQNLYRYDRGGKRDTQLTRFADADVRWPSTDGKNIVFERDGYLWLYDIASASARKLNPKIPSENLQARPYLRNLANQISAISLSPSGVRVAVEARGELFSVPAKAGDTRNLTQTSGARERVPRWSPDGRQIAYIGDATGNYELYLEPELGGPARQVTHNSGLSMSAIDWSPDGKTIAINTESNELWLANADTGKLTRVIKAAYGLGDWDWSPDSKWIALIDAGANTFGALNLYEVATGKMNKVTEGYYDDNSVSWDLGGKYLYLTSTRTFNPGFGQYEFSLKVQDAQRVYVIPLAADTGNPLVQPSEEEPEPPAAKPGGPPTGGGAPSSPAVKVDLDGMADRMVPLPMGASTYPFIVGVNNGVLYFSNGTLSKFDLGSRDSTALASGAPGGGMALSFNPNRTKMAYYAGGTLGVVDIRPGITLGQGRVDTSAVEAVVNPHDEWKQIFWEAWRYERDNFYDPNMVGLDWNGIGRRYAGYLQYVNHRADLSYVLGMMLGELGTGHAYVQGGDMGPMPAPVPVGQLGVDYAVEGNYVRLKKIYRGQQFEEARRGPLGEPGISVKDGEYLLAIDGKEVNAGIHPGSLLINKVGRFVTLTVNDKPSKDGARKVRVRPVGSENQLRYAEWAEANRKLVAKLSGGRIGYMHIPNTQLDGAIEFTKGFYGQTDKDAMIVDERWNGGGYIQPWFVDTLARKIKAGIQSRNSIEDTSDAVAIEGPKVMLINQYAGSGGDFFPWMFRHSNVGLLIGKRTWGGLVGISGGVPLVDGGSVTAPEFSIYDRTTGDIIAENRGVDPDIDVDLRPDLVAKGEDPQLQKAVDVLLEQLKKMPPRKKRTRIPPVGKEGRIGG